MSFDPQDYTVVVAGATRGVGLAIFRRFAELGARVSGWDRGCAAIEGDRAFSHVAQVDVTGGRATH